MIKSGVVMLIALTMCLFKQDLGKRRNLQYINHIVYVDMK